MVKIKLFGARGLMSPGIVRQGFLALACLMITAINLLAGGQSSEANYITAHAASITPHLQAYGQVKPISVLAVTAAEPGVIAGLRVVPGSQVQRGEILAHLTGPEIQAMLLEGLADVRSTQAEFIAARKSLEILQHQLGSHLSTRQAVHQAEGALAQAQTNFENAQSRLQSDRQLMTLTSPSSGKVLALSAADGQLVNTNQSILTLQASGRLWLKAAYYGADMSAIRIGMGGTFSPADGGKPVSVRVREVLGPLTTGGAETVALAPTAAESRWKNGEYGTVRLNLPKRMMVAVPTRALILNQGKWWVLLHTPRGDQAQAVIPGPARGWQTFLKSGLAPGAQVVVENAYFLFHQSIAQNYQPPD